MLIEAAAATVRGGYAALDRELVSLLSEVGGLRVIMLVPRRGVDAVLAVIEEAVGRRDVVLGNALPGPAEQVGLRPAHACAVLAQLHMPTSRQPATARTPGRARLFSAGNALATLPQ